MKLVFDCDDVLLDWIGGFRAYLNSIGIHPATDEPDSWDMKNWVGQDALPLIKNFNSSPRFGRLKSLPGTIGALGELSCRNEIIVLSSCIVEGAPVYSWRKENLQSQFGDIFSRVLCCPLGSEKTALLAAVGGDVWVEDNYKHAMAGHNLGYKTFMVRRPHNMHLEDRPDSIEWIDSVVDLVSRYT